MVIMVGPVPNGNGFKPGVEEKESEYDGDGKKNQDGHSPWDPTKQ